MKGMVDHSRGLLRGWAGAVVAVAAGVAFAGVPAYASAAGTGASVAPKVTVASGSPVTNAEQVTPQSFPSGYRLLRNYHTGLCMAANTTSSVTVTRCDPSGNSHTEDWLFTHVGALGGIDVFEITTYHFGPNVCLDNEPSGVVMLPCTGNHAQLWWWHVGDVAIAWQDYHTGNVIDAQNGRVVADTWTGNHSQQWYQCPGNPPCSQIGL